MYDVMSGSTPDYHFESFNTVGYSIESKSGIVD